MEENIKTLERFLRICDEGLFTEISIRCDGPARQAIENLIKAYKELEEEKEIYKTELEKVDVVLNLKPGYAAPERYEIVEGLKRGIIQLEKIIKNSIPKSTIKENMKKYEYAMNGYDSSTANSKQSQDVGSWIALQKLLEG